MDLVTIKNISKCYGDKIALKNISLDVRKGEIFGLLGPNGAGKTTLLRIINQLSLVDSGVVEIDGREIRFADNNKIGYLPEERGLYPKLTVKEQIKYFAQLKGVSKNVIDSRTSEWVEKFELLPLLNKRLETLSKGNQQKVQMICALIHNPEFIILDEPLSGFDPVNAELFSNIIRDIAKKGTIVIISSHDMNSVENLCNRIALINNGEMVLYGSVEDIKQKYRNERYELSIVGEINPSPFYTVDKIASTTEINSYELTKVSTISNNDLIQDIMKYGDIISFKEKLPSLNDIFIKCVTNE